MMVKCCRTYEEVYDGDVGKVIKLDRDGLHDLNVQCDWQQKGGTYWVRYIHIELLGMCFIFPLKVDVTGPILTDMPSALAYYLRFPTTKFSLSH